MRLASDPLVTTVCQRKLPQLVGTRLRVIACCHNMKLAVPPCDLFGY